ncbi:MAG: hypothetical protein H6706_28335 [Myxococcales bacterium]|nr:hypothetical protein [Myxococcales bacterium]
MATPPAFDFLCPEANRLAGDGPTLYCVRCDRDVHDLSAMTATEAEQFLAGCAGKALCVRYDLDVATGTMRHRPERRAGRLGRVTLALGVSISGLALGQAVVRPAAPPRPGAGAVTGQAFASGPMERLQASVEAALQEAALKDAARTTLALPPPTEEEAPASTEAPPAEEPPTEEPAAPPSTADQHEGLLRVDKRTVRLGGAIAPVEWRSTRTPQ